jgi:hypothetical protein
MTKVNRIELKTPFALDRVNCYYIKDSTPTLVDAGVNTRRPLKPWNQKSGRPVVKSKN